MNAQQIDRYILDDFFPDATAHDEPTTETTVVSLTTECDILPFLVQLANELYQHNEEGSIAIVLDYENKEVRITDID